MTEEEKEVETSSSDFKEAVEEVKEIAEENVELAEKAEEAEKTGDAEEATRLADEAEANIEKIDEIVADVDTTNASEEQFNELIDAEIHALDEAIGARESNDASHFFENLEAAVERGTSKAFEAFGFDRKGVSETQEETSSDEDEKEEGKPEDTVTGALEESSDSVEEVLAPDTKPSAEPSRSKERSGKHHRWGTHA